MNVGDIDAVLDIERQSQDFPWSYALFADCLRPHYQCWLLQESGDPAIIMQTPVVGFAILQHIVDEATLLNIALDPRWRGQGAGRWFLQQVIQRCPDSVRLLYLEVRESNHRARHLYESLGFNEFTLRRQYYPRREGGREDAVLMQLSLDVQNPFSQEFRF